MFDANAPAVIAALRAALAASPSWIAAVASAGNESARVHYPSAAFSAVVGGSDVMPAVVIDLHEPDYAILAPGLPPLESGNLDLVVYLPAAGYGATGTTWTAAAAEALGDALVRDLIATTTICWRGSARRRAASDPTPGMHAAAADGTGPHYHTVHITLGYGLTA